MGRFAGDPEYTLEWPPELFDQELRRLMNRLGDHEARALDEIDRLLEEAFVSQEPHEEWHRIRDLSYGQYEEPF